MILILDNYDSFTYNLVHTACKDGEEIVVLRNDEKTPQMAEALNPRVLIISPGPGKPSEAGYSEEYIDYFKNKIPILGICLGHQAICEAFGGEIVHAKKIMHGMKDTIKILEDPIFKGLEESIEAGRYHSLAAEAESLPEDLNVIALADDGEIMGVHHKKYPVWGLQFHPESIMTPDGPHIIENFLKISQEVSK